MDCLYHAYAAHAAYLGVNLSRYDWALYKAAKTATHGIKPQMTFGGVVPWMLTLLCNRHNLLIAESQHRIYTPELYVQSAETRLARRIAGQSDFGDEVDQITIQPAIYLDLSNHHAVFSRSLPKGGIVIAAYKIERKG